MFRGGVTRLDFSRSLMVWVTRGLLYPQCPYFKHPLLFPLGCAGGPLSVYAILDYVLSPRESWKSIHYALWKKTVPQATDWALSQKCSAFLLHQLKQRHTLCTAEGYIMIQNNLRLFINLKFWDNVCETFFYSLWSTYSHHSWARMSTNKDGMREQDTSDTSFVGK